MIHKKCTGKLVLDCTSMYLIQSPSIKITVNGVFPGVVQIDSNKAKGNARLICSKCGDTFSTKNEFEDEVLETCGLCGKNYPPSEIKINDYFTGLCIHCISKINSSKLDVSEIKDRMLYMYGEILNKIDSPTLLTILMKK